MCGPPEALDGFAPRRNRFPRPPAAFGKASHGGARGCKSRLSQRPFRSSFPRHLHHGRRRTEHHRQLAAVAAGHVTRFFTAPPGLLRWAEENPPFSKSRRPCTRNIRRALARTRSKSQGAYGLERVGLAGICFKLLASIGDQAALHKPTIPARDYAPHWHGTRFSRHAPYGAQYRRK